MTGDGKNPLLDAFCTLVAASDPERAARILRHGIRLLVETNPQRRLGSKKDADAWSEIRDRLRAAMAAGQITAQVLADELELSVSTIDKASAPMGPVPSQATIARIADWLSGRATGNGVHPAGSAAPNTGPTPATVNLDAQNRGSKFAETEWRQKPAPLQPEVPSSRPVAAANGHTGTGPDLSLSLPARRLTPAEGEALAFVLAHDPQALRQVTSIELAERAVAGAVLPGAAVHRLIEVLGDRKQ